MVASTTVPITLIKMDNINTKFAIDFANWIGTEYIQDEGTVVGNIYYERGSDHSIGYDVSELLEIYLSDLEGDGYIFELSNFLKVGKRVLVSKEHGKECKDILNIDKILENNKITFIVPEYVISVNPSFLEAFFGDSITKYGSDAFLKKVKFKHLGIYNINSNLLETIQRVERKIINKKIDER